MNGFTILILILIGSIIILVGTSAGIFFVIRKLSPHKSLRLLALVPILTVVFFVYQAFYPDDEFYKEDFKEVTQIDFPAEGKIIYKSASYPDQFGDYGSVSVVELNGESYQKLLTHLPSIGFTSEEECGAFYLENALQELDNNQIEKEYCLTGDLGKAFYVAFISDKQSVIVSRQSW